MNVAENPAPFEAAWAPLPFREIGSPGLAVGHRVVYDVKANWKLVFQNYSVLPLPDHSSKLATVLPYLSGANDLWRARSSAATEIKAPNRAPR